MSVDQSQLALSWKEHVQNICNGLSLLQQNGEFVDMTLAADGHHVKVHQVVLALCSPYLKDLISAAQCPHPVIYLSKISHTTLSSLLEYMYNGEVSVAVDDIKDLIDAAKELHIKGLQDMTFTQSLGRDRQKSTEVLSTQSECLNPEEDIHYFEISNLPEELNKLKKIQNNGCGVIVSNINNMQENIDELYEMDMTDEQDNETIVIGPDIEGDEVPQTENSMNVGSLQYTVSNQGSLQMILNRFIYYLKHTNRDMSRQWRCVEYVCNAKCPAYVFTKNDAVIQRISAHNHPFHDKRILKKVQEGAVFGAIHEAETEYNLMKNQLEKNQIE